MPRATVGGIKIPDLGDILCVDHSDDREHRFEVYGYLGMDALRELVVRIDFDRGRLYFLRAAPPDAGTPIHLQRTTLCPTICAAVGGRRRLFNLDTGCWIYGAGAIPSADFADLRSRGDLSVVGEAPLTTDFDVRVHPAGVLRVPLSVGDYNHTHLVLNDLGAAANTTSGILGLGYLRRYVVTFDFPRKVVYLKPATDFRQLDLVRDPGGLRFRQDANRLLVSAVAWKCPARAAGIEEDDVVESVNGCGVARLDEVELIRSLGTTAGDVSLVLRRASDGRLIDYAYAATAPPQARAPAGQAPKARDCE